ncbi:hypothetical protein A8C32_18865 [Flavivirga aquatica]|uniref:Glycosyltransferase 2-like domain-containing protein n=1 Tax=Flavivirga aquatica TaxID=1849968 RepID=A0A1E5T3Y9_9FLAO|nr:hypothetical protein [Flavivirga aquatica]OEK06094.1 hypothetical protein A8C32_18865 [Flavivirga aquatica]
MIVKNNFFLIGVVLFKEKLLEASTICSLIKIVDDLNKFGSKLVIWDNSPYKQEEKDCEFLESLFNQFYYKHTPENMSLAKVYNNMYKANLGYSFFVLFDQDSEFSVDYFNKVLLESFINKKINLFLPIIKTGDLIASPANRFFVTGRYWKEKRTGLVDAKNKLAITSGMAISINYLKKEFKEFNENLNLYGIDSHFMINYEKFNDYFFVLDYEMKHDLSYFNNEDLEKKLFRFLNHKESIIEVYKKESVLLNIISRFFILGSSIKMSILNKDIRFLIKKKNG